MGPDTEHTLYAADWAIRASLIFGGKKPGDFKEHLLYQKDRVFAFAIVLGPLDDIKWVTGAGAINMGFPAIADTDIPVIHPTGVCTYEEVEKELDHSKIVQKAIELRGLKIVVEKPPIPVAFGPAFEGERIRKEDTFIEFGGQRTPAFEWANMREMDEIEDNKVIIVGKDAEARYEKGGQMPLGILIEVAGRKMQKDFESVIERKIHGNLNEAQGVWHMGQRDINWVRISKNAKNDGFTLRHIGDLLNAADAPHLPLDRGQGAGDALRRRGRREAEARGGARRLQGARQAPRQHDRRGRRHLLLLPALPVLRAGPCLRHHARAARPLRRLQLARRQGGLRDRPDRRQPADREGRRCMDARYGRYEGVDEYLKKVSGRRGREPEPLHDHGKPDDLLRLLRVHHRDRPRGERRHDRQPRLHRHDPDGHEVLDAGRHGRRRRADPGLHGRRRELHLTSKKFLFGDGGLKRIVWMPKDLKERIAEEFKKRAEEAGVPDLLDKIADETICEDSEKLVEYLTAVGHPALEMEPIVQ